MDLGIAGRTALVTGASQGIGRAVALRFGAAGVNLFLVARNEDALREVAAEVDADVQTIAADVATRDGCARIVDRVDTTTIEILVNNAGGTRPTPIFDLTDDDIDEALQLNLVAAMRLCRDLVPRMRGWGRVINVASIAAREPHRVTAHYGAAKAGLVTYTKALSTAVGRSGVTVNAVLPGYTWTATTSRNFEERLPGSGMAAEDLMARMGDLRNQSMGRWGQPDDVAAAVVFLASEAASWITGVALPVDGGAVKGVW